MSKKILFAGAFPPPVGGQANINEMLADALSKQSNVVRLNLSAGRLDRGIRYHFSRVIRLFMALGIIFNTKTNGDDTVYLSADSGLGLLYNCLVAALARAKRVKIFIHYHSFTFVDDRSLMFLALLRLAGRKAVHVVLCSCMVEKLERLYGALSNTIISSNTYYFKAPDESHQPRQSHGLRIGLLSHLSDQKGLDLFLQLVEDLKRQQISFRAVLAGPPVTTRDEERIKEACTKNYDCLEYRGAVFGALKEKFFQDIDVFIFPTRFRVEAQPLVLIEALAHGKPIISFGRGCIFDDLEGSGSLVIDPAGDFARAAQQFLTELDATPGLYQTRSMAAYQQFKLLRSRSQSEFENLITRIT